MAAAYGYDASGNIATDSTETTVYDLTDDQRLASVTKGGVTAGAYQYDGRGLRTVKTVNGEDTLFVSCKSGKLIAEADSDGNITKEYIYLEGDIFAHFQYEVPVAPLEATVAVNEPSTKEAPEPVIADNPSAVAATSTPSDTAFLQPIFFLLLLQNKSAEGAYYYVTDHLGAPQIITDDSGSVVWKAEYLPFGKVNVSVSQIENNLRFPGQYFDAETGLHYNWNRYYDPETGRYIAADPIGLGGGINLYAYVGSDPVNGVDLEGLNPNLFAPGGEREPDQFDDEAHAGLKHFFDNYKKMREANTIGADKYFHCMANCQAAKEGDGGYAVAVIISEGREQTDIIRKGNTPQQQKDSASDRAANRQGRNFDPCKTCKQQCSSLRPKGLDPKY